MGRSTPAAASGAPLRLVVSHTGRARYYVHGDYRDDASGLAFCAACGMFEWPDHFPACERSRVANGRASDAALIRRGLAIVNKRAAPVVAVLFAKDAERAAREWRERWARRNFRPANVPTIWSRRHD